MNYHPPLAIYSGRCCEYPYVVVRRPVGSRRVKKSNSFKMGASLRSVYLHYKSSGKNNRIRNIKILRMCTWIKNYSNSHRLHNAPFHRITGNDEKTGNLYILLFLNQNLTSFQDLKSKVAKAFAHVTFMAHE